MGEIRTTVVMVDDSALSVREDWLSVLVEEAHQAVALSAVVPQSDPAHGAVRARADAACTAVGAVLGLHWKEVREAWFTMQNTPGLWFVGALAAAQADKRREIGK